MNNMYGSPNSTGYANPNQMPSQTNYAQAFNFNQINPQLFNQFGGFQNFQNQFNTFANNFMNGMAGNMPTNPQQAVQQALDRGQMSPQQFAMLRRQANMLTGMNL